MKGQYSIEWLRLFTPKEHNLLLIRGVQMSFRYNNNLMYVREFQLLVMLNPQKRPLLHADRNGASSVTF